MEETEFYKKHRPQSLGRMIGCEATAKALASMIEKKTLPHAILLTGPSGCGKTTIARIIKDELGCHDTDFKEMNSASFRGIDTIREIQRNMNLHPTGGPVRVWLLDEVHKLSNDAQNAALKMLEDTPDHVYFLLCTTDPSKVIKAIQTRCTDMPVRSLTENELKELIRRVAKKEKIELDAATEDELANSAMGSARTALVLLGKIAHLDPAERVEAIKAKLAEESVAYDLCKAVMGKVSWGKIAGILKNLKDDPEGTRRSVLGYARSCLLSKADWSAYNVIASFREPFFDTGTAPALLAAACYEAWTAKE